MSVSTLPEEAYFSCDGCKTRVEGQFNGVEWLKPHSWFERSDHDGKQLACSRECIEVVAKNTGKTNLVLPI